MSIYSYSVSYFPYRTTRADPVPHPSRRKYFRRTSSIASLLTTVALYVLAAIYTIAVLVTMFHNPHIWDRDYPVKAPTLEKISTVVLTLTVSPRRSISHRHILNRSRLLRLRPSSPTRSCGHACGCSGGTTRSCTACPSSSSSSHSVRLPSLLAPLPPPFPLPTRSTLIIRPPPSPSTRPSLSQRCSKRP